MVALENPQRFGGSDVMNRISFDSGPGNGELRYALRKALNHELRELYARRGIDRREVYEIVVVGNSTMRDLFFGLDVAPIGERPYKSVTELELLAGERESTELFARAHELGLWAHPQARIWGAPLIAGHVGADVAADLLSAEPRGDERPRDDAGRRRHEHRGRARRARTYPRRQLPGRAGVRGRAGDLRHAGRRGRRSSRCGSSATAALRTRPSAKGAARPVRIRAHRPARRAAPRRAA